MSVEGPLKDANKNVKKELEKLVCLCLSLSSGSIDLYNNRQLARDRANAKPNLHMLIYFVFFWSGLV